MENGGKKEMKGVLHIGHFTSHSCFVGNHIANIIIRKTSNPMMAALCMISTITHIY